MVDEGFTYKPILFICSKFGILCWLFDIQKRNEEVTGQNISNGNSVKRNIHSFHEKTAQHK